MRLVHFNERKVRVTSETKCRLIWDASVKLKTMDAEFNESTRLFHFHMTLQALGLASAPDLPSCVFLVFAQTESKAKGKQRHGIAGNVKSFGKQVKLCVPEDAQNGELALPDLI